MNCKVQTSGDPCAWKWFNEIPHSTHSTHSSLEPLQILRKQNDWLILAVNPDRTLREFFFTSRKTEVRRPGLDEWVECGVSLQEIHAKFGGSDFHQIMEQS